MTIELLDGRYWIRQYESNGLRCWEVHVRGKKLSDYFTDDLDRALRWIAGFHMTQVEGWTNGSHSLIEGIERIWQIQEELRDEVRRILGDDCV